MNQFYQSLLSKYYFAIEDSYSDQFISIIANAHKGIYNSPTKTELKAAKKLRMMHSYSASAESSILETDGYKKVKDIPSGSIVQLNFEGPVTKYDQWCGGIGTLTLEKDCLNFKIIQM